MKNDIFVDTSGFYALLIRGDDRHEAAAKLLRESKRRQRRFVTTDYVLDETATLLKARGHAHLLSAFFETVLNSAVCRVHWTDADDFLEIQAYFLKHADQPWSFTDCHSFRLMKKLRLTEALTKDGDFARAGFLPLLK